MTTESRIIQPKVSRKGFDRASTCLSESLPFMILPALATGQGAILDLRRINQLRRRDGDRSAHNGYRGPITWCLEAGKS